SLQDTWIGDTWRAPGGAVLDRAAGTVSTPSGATGTFASLQSAWSDIQKAVSGGQLTELQAGMNIIAAVKAAGADAKTLDAAMGWPTGQSNNWATAHGLQAFAQGTNYLTSDGPIYAHAGEEIKPRAYVDMDRSARDETNALLARLIDSVADVSAEVAELKKPMDATATATERGTALYEGVLFGGFSEQTRAAGTPA
ncbi:MAG: hypothetical protein NT159_05700, partial [Proteobacteria bacterium]|nr:hypothetical protein [Pseudomonadota bacterium]